MNHQIIKNIIEDVFEKAKNDSPSHSVNALTNFIEEHSKLSYKTLERAHKKYIDDEETTWSPNGASVSNFCKFLGYDDYKDYKEKTKRDDSEIEEPTIIIIPEDNFDTSPNPNNDDLNENDNQKKRKWIWIVIICLSTITLVFLYDHLIKTKVNKGNDPLIGCMAWAKDHYEEVECDLSMHPIYGTKVERLVPERMEAMRKVEVDAATPFFSEETGKPLIWYFKGKNARFEYFTSPGLHPVNGETLRKITPGIIQNHVPIHKMNKDSFIESTSDSDNSNQVNITNTNLGIAIFNTEGFDERLSSKILEVYFKGNPSNIYLKDKKIYDQDFIESFNSKMNLKNNKILTNIDTLCLGITEYTFIKSKMSEDRINCTIKLKLDFYSKAESQWIKIKDKFIERTGTGYSREEAIANTIKKINYE